MLLQPAVAVEPGGGIQRMACIIEVHLFVLGAEAVQIFLGHFTGDGIAGSKLQEDAFAVGMAQKIYRIVPRVLMEIFADVFHARFFYMGNGVRVGAGEGLFLVGVATGHEHVTTYTRLNAGQNRAYVRVPTVANESNAMAI